MIRCVHVFQVPDEHTGAVVDLLSRRKGEMLNMSPVEGSGETQMTNIEYVVPTRGMIGLRNSMLTATRGTAVMDTIFNSYKPYAGMSDAQRKSFKCFVVCFPVALIVLDDDGHGLVCVLVVRVILVA